MAFGVDLRCWFDGILVIDLCGLLFWLGFGGVSFRRFCGFSVWRLLSRFWIDL